MFKFIINFWRSYYVIIDKLHLEIIDDRWMLIYHVNLIKLHY